MTSTMPSSENLGKVIVIGGCGLLGRHVVGRLLESGSTADQIFVFDISTNNNRWDGVTYISGDVGSKSELAAAFDQAKPRVIFNLASPFFKIQDENLHRRCNVTGVVNVIECAQERSIPVLVHSSSSEVIQRGYDAMVWATEEWPVQENPVNGNIYAKSKAIGEDIVLKANRQKGLLTTSIRCCTLFGEGDIVLTRHFIDLAREGKLKFQTGDGTNLYDYIYAGNAADGHILAARALLKASASTETILNEKRIDGEIFTLSNGNPWPFWNVGRFIAGVAGHPVEEKDVWKVPIGIVLFFMSVWEYLYWMGTLGGSPSITTDMMRYTTQVRTFDITKARQRLGYEPRVGMEEGLRRGVEWNLSQEGKSTKIA